MGSLGGAFGMPRGALEGPLATPVRTFGVFGLPVGRFRVSFGCLWGAFRVTAAKLELIWVSLGEVLG